MKAAALAAGCGVFAFVLVGIQMGTFSEPAPKIVAQEEPAKVEKKPAKFPEALAPACKGQPVPEAADVDVRERKPAYRLALIKVAGGLHSWHTHLKSDWKADTVEATEFVVVLSPQRKTLLSVQHYPNGAPPVSRYKFELEASVVAAKSGRVLCYKKFVSVPRPVNNIEAWELTAIEEPVTFATVFNWAASQAHAGFVQEVGTVGSNE